VSDVLEMGEEVFVKVIAIQEGGKMSLSMKHISQRDGEDQDPNNVELELKANKRKEYSHKPQSPLRLQYALPTTCLRCGGKGHLAIECYASKGTQGYSLVEEEQEKNPDETTTTKRKEPDTSSELETKDKKKHKKDKKDKKDKKEKKDKKDKKKDKENSKSEHKHKHKKKSHKGSSSSESE